MPTRTLTATPPQEREWLTRPDVQLMQYETLKEYDRYTAQPRHEALMGKVSILEAKATGLEAVIRAAAKTIAWPSAVLACLGIAKIIIQFLKLK